MNQGERTASVSFWLEQRIGEGERLLAELPPRSGWVPIVKRRLRELRDSLAETRPALTA